MNDALTTILITIWQLTAAGVWYYIGVMEERKKCNKKLKN